MRVVALLLTVLTGFSGLVYEVTWEKYLATLLGSHSEATSAVLGIFLGGLAAGYSWFGKLTRRLIERADALGRPARLLWVYGFVEIAIGCYAWAFPYLFGVISRLSLAAPHASRAAGFGLDLVLSAALILPPTLLMGGTIPLLTQALSRNTSESTRVHAFVYGFNTIGAFVGAIAAGFFLIPKLGLVDTMTHTAGVNLFAGGAFVLLGVRRQSPMLEPRPGEAPRNRPVLPRVEGFLVASLLLGFSMMTVQIVAIRISGLAFGASQFTFATVVAVFVLCIALGSLSVSAFGRIPNGVIAWPPWLLVVALCVLDPLLERAPYGAHVLRSLFSTDLSAFVPYQFAVFGSLFFAIGPPALLSGAALPLLFQGLRSHVFDLGDTAGRLYGWNSLGSLLGALVGGYLLFFWLDLDQVYRIAIIALAVCGTILIVTVHRTSWKVAGIPLIASIGLVSFQASWRPEYLMSGLFRERAPLPETRAGPERLMSSLRSLPFVFHVDDPVASIGVGEHRRGDRLVARTIVTNGKSDGNTHSDYPTMGLLAAVPAWLAERVERAFVVGLGTGVTAAELAALEKTQEVVVAEISAGVVEALPYFDFANMNASTNPLIRIERRDAHRALLDTDGVFDVIVSEPSNPWMAGVEMLYSREFLAAARDRLAPGGVHCQWFHLYESDEQSLGLVLRTYAEVFERIAIWYGRGNDLLLLGFESRSPALGIERLEARFERADFRESFRRAGVESFPALLAHELLPTGVVERLNWEGPIHSHLEPRLGYAAARAYFVGGEARLPFTGFGPSASAGRRNSLWRRYRATPTGGSEDSQEQFVRTVCANRNPECVAAIADWEQSFPRSARPTQVLENLEQSVYTFGGEFHRLALKRYRSAFTRPASDLLELAQIRRAVRRYTQHYFHAAPPPPEALIDLWSRCRTADTQDTRCAVGIARARMLTLSGD